MLFRGIGKSPGRLNRQGEGFLPQGDLPCGGIAGFECEGPFAGFSPFFARGRENSGRFFRRACVEQRADARFMPCCVQGQRFSRQPGRRAGEGRKTLMQPTPSRLSSIRCIREETRGGGVDHGFCFFAAVQRQRFSGMPFRICRVGRGACPARVPEGKSTVSVSFCSALDGEG